MRGIDYRRVFDPVALGVVEPGYFIDDRCVGPGDGLVRQCKCGEEDGN
jgi:hypothetical protein